MTGGDQWAESKSFVRAKGLGVCRFGANTRVIVLVSAFDAQEPLLVIEAAWETLGASSLSPCTVLRELFSEIYLYIYKKKKAYKVNNYIFIK